MCGEGLLVQDDKMATHSTGYQADSYL